MKVIKKSNCLTQTIKIITQRFGFFGNEKCQKAIHHLLLNMCGNTCTLTH